MDINLISVNRIPKYALLVLWGMLWSLKGLAAPPANDAICSSTLILEKNSCTNTGGTLLNATASGALPGACGSASSVDVWYSFVATMPYPIITLSNFGTGFQAAIPTLQIFSGACGSPTSLYCLAGANSSITSLTLGVGSTIAGAGLTVGQTYLIRVTTQTNTGSTAAGSWGFNICIANPVTPTVDYGKSYINLTKGTVGGTIEPGDNLQVRATLVIKAGSIFQASFTDNIPSNTTYVPGTLKILTNEGKVFRSWTDVAGDDPGTISGSAVTINLGGGATNAMGGGIAAIDKPSLFKSQCILVASYQVQVTGGYGSKVGIGYGSISYIQYNALVSSAHTINFPADTIMVSLNSGVCTNTVGGNAILSESGGTFGSGTLKDRVPSSKVPSNYTYATFTNGAPQDYYYGVSNNTSANGVGYSTVNTWPIPDVPSATTHRVFNVWDIIGDHTGAASPTAGNPPADTAAGPGGYMVVINSAYRTDTAFLDTVKNLCPNTYYQYSAWFRNICSLCACDSNGVTPGNAGYIPTALNDSSGVYPDMTFNINGYDYYTTGEIQHSGQWVQKGFTYLTGPSETQMIISIRNNAPGGGGNDWAVDDIGVATCTPNLAMNPSPTVNVCIGNQVDMSAIVTSYFANYTSWLWEKSSDNGVTWTSTGISGTGTPVLVAGQYQYTATYPSFISDSSDNKNIYRIRIATNSTNINDPNCSFVASTNILVYVNNCMFVLATRIKTFEGKAVNNYGNLQWTTENEKAGISYIVERSADGASFQPVGTLPALADASGLGSYTFTDKDPLAGPAYYRIKLTDGNINKFSSVISLNTNGQPFEVKNIVNPFNGYISFDVVSPDNRSVQASLFDSYGKLVHQKQFNIRTGLTRLLMPELVNLAVGNYILRVQSGNQVVNRQVIKKLP